MYEQHRNPSTPGNVIAQLSALDMASLPPLTCVHVDHDTYQDRWSVLPDAVDIESFWLNVDPKITFWRVTS